jgi:hypothetical protein
VGEWGGPSLLCVSLVCSVVACSVCPSIFLLVVCLSLAFLYPIAAKALTWAEPYHDLDGFWSEKLAAISALGHSWTRWAYVAAGGSAPVCSGADGCKGWE